MLSCREVAGMLASERWRDAPPGRRVGLVLHLAMCRHCRAYRRALRRLGRGARRLYRTVAPDPAWSERVLGVVRQAAEQGRTG